MESVEWGGMWRLQDLPTMKLLTVAPEQGSGCLTQYDAMKGRANWRCIERCISNTLGPADCGDDGQGTAQDSLAQSPGYQSPRRGCVEPSHTKSLKKWPSIQKSTLAATPAYVLFSLSKEEETNTMLRDVK